jgi:hypothetical protein
LLLLRPPARAPRPRPCLAPTLRPSPPLPSPPLPSPPPASLLKTHRESKFSFVQLTLQIPSRQRFSAHSRRGHDKYELVAGDPSQVVDVLDTWVIERKLFDPQGLKQKLTPQGARWRLAARLQLEDPEARQGA